MSIVDQIREAYNPDLTLAGVLGTKYDSRTTLSGLTMDSIRQQGLPVFKTQIRITVDIIRAQMERQPISLYAPGSNGDIDYMALADELLPARVIPLAKRS